MNEELLRLAKIAGARAAARGVLLSAAESCTGGMLSAALTHWPGSSRWFGRGFVCYANAAKTEMLHVPAEVIKQFGAASEQTAAAMCRGAGDFSMAITGIAGPSADEKPAGVVCFGWRAGGEIETETRRFFGGRGEVREQAASHALRRMAALLE
ncbi:MAG: CinA family protein [Betaproteobacteria bacterium]|nr:CinA family protein [Betaproteobacteria bacterium]